MKTKYEVSQIELDGDTLYEEELKTYQEKMNKSIDGLVRQGEVESTQNFSEFFVDSSESGEIKNVEVFTEENNGQY